MSQFKSHSISPTSPISHTVSGYWIFLFCGLCAIVLSAVLLLVANTWERFYKSWNGFLQLIVTREPMPQLEKIDLWLSNLITTRDTREMETKKLKLDSCFGCVWEPTETKLWEAMESEERRNFAVSSTENSHVPVSSEQFLLLNVSRPMPLLSLYYSAHFLSIPLSKLVIDCRCIKRI